MKLFDVYDLLPIKPIKGENCKVYDEHNQTYLDLYGGHAVISVGHSHPYYIECIQKQLNKIGFYSNSIINPLQDELAEKLGDISGYQDYSLFLCNSGAEAIENACKIASFHNKKSKILYFENGFHGRTSLAVSMSNMPSAIAPVNENTHVIKIPLNSSEMLKSVLNEDFAAVIIEGIQGLGGIHEPTKEFMILLRTLCSKFNVSLILDEIQSGYGRTGNFFAHQINDLKPDLITIAKGMANGLPMGGVLIAPHFKAQKSILGTTFGGNHLACAAAIAVLEIIKKENLIENAHSVGNYLLEKLMNIDHISNVRGRGLMIAFDYKENASILRKKLLFEGKIFTGSAKSLATVRLLPPLTLSKNEVDLFTNTLTSILHEGI